MSYVLTVVIQMEVYLHEEEMALKSLNKWLAENNHLGGEFKFLDSGQSAGTKCPDVRVVWGGFNYLDTAKFIEFFKSLKIRNSLLTVKSPDEGPYTIAVSDEHTVIHLQEAE